MAVMSRLRILLLDYCMRARREGNTDLDTQYKIAAHLGIVPARISEWSNGRAPIPPRYIRTLCEFFDISPEELVAWVDTETNENVSVRLRVRHDDKDHGPQQMYEPVW